MSEIGDKESQKKILHYGIYFFAGIVILILGLLLCRLNRVFGLIIAGIGLLLVMVAASIMNHYNQKQEKLELKAELKQRKLALNREKRESRKFDVKRYPIKKGDKAQYEELEVATKKFLENYVAPEGFYEFLDKFNNCENSKSFILYKFEPVSMLGANYFHLNTVSSSSEINNYNYDFITKKDDYHRMFRNVLFFADDATGHNHFFLDYSNGLENPKVKFLQDETDNVLLVATTFKEMLDNLVDENYVKDVQSIEMKGADFSNWIAKGVKSLRAAKSYVVNIYEDSDYYTCDLVSTNSRNFEEDIDEEDTYCRENPFVISKKMPIFDNNDILTHFKNLLDYAISFNASFNKFYLNHNILYGFVDGDLISYNQFTTISNLNESQIYELKTSNISKENISKDELICYFDEKFKQKKFFAIQNKWIGNYNGKFLVFEIQDSIYNKDVFYFNIGICDDLKIAKGDHKNWKIHQRLLFDENSKKTFLNTMQWFNSHKDK